MKHTLIKAGIALSAAAAAAAIVALGNKGKGPAKEIRNETTRRRKGNSPDYHPARIKEKPDSVLKGKHILFLGSSITLGSDALGVSFADYLAAADGVVADKDAVSGTTLANLNEKSYVARLRNHVNDHYDAVVVQLSTNDAFRKVPLGALSASRTELYDEKTVIGALESIFRFVEQKFGCPVFLYTNPKYNSAEYQKMVDAVPSLARKWGVHVIDLWNDNTFNDITPAQRQHFMADDKHPTQAGYLLWWLPVFEKKLSEVL